MRSLETLDTLTLFAAVSALFATAVPRHCDLRHWRDTFTVWVVHVKELIFPAIPAYVCQFFHSTTGLVSAATLSVALHCHWHLGIHFFRTILCDTGARVSICKCDPFVPCACA